MASLDKEIVFIRPPIKLVSSSKLFSVQYPVNIGLLAAELNKKSYNVSLFDYLVEEFNLEAFNKAISKRRKIYCISCFSNNISSGNVLAKQIKLHSPDSLVVVGGIHVTVNPKETLKSFEYFDVLLYGEADNSLLELADKFFENKSIFKIKGLVFRKNNDIIKNPPSDVILDLDTLLFPIRNLKPLSLYKKSHVSKGFSRKFMNIAEVITSRGCIYNCIFCSSPSMPKLRQRSVENVISEIELLVKEYSINHISFEDDILTYDSSRMKFLCSELKRLGLTWNCNTHVNLVDKDLLYLMIDSGCKKISFGVESGSPRILKLIRKSASISQYKKVFSWCKSLGLKYIEATFLIGSYPDETIEDIEMTRNLIKYLDPDFIVIGIACPYPGTKLYDLMLSENLIDLSSLSNSMFNFGAFPSWKTKNFSAKELFTIQKRMIRYFYFSPKYLFKRLLLIRNFSDLRYFFGVLLTLVRNYMFR